MMNILPLLLACSAQNGTSFESRADRSHLDTASVSESPNEGHPDDGGNEDRAEQSWPVLSCPALTLEERVVFSRSDLPRRDGAIIFPVGLSVGDFNRDGWQDIVVGYTGGSTILYNDGTGNLQHSDNEPRMSNGQPLPIARSVTVADLDADGWPDIVLGTEKGRPIWILWNNGDQAQYSAQQLPDSSQYSTTLSLADFDGDGDLDLFAAASLASPLIEELIENSIPGDPSRLYLNEGSRRFNDVSERIPAGAHDGHTFQASVLDVEGDGDLDLYMVNDFGAWVRPNELLLNDGSAHFTIAEDCSCELPMFGMGGGVGDANDDGWPDLYLTDIGGPNLLMNLGDGSFYDATLSANAAIPGRPEQLTSWGTTFVDLDADGFEDIATVFGQLNQVNADTVDQLDPDWVDGEVQYDALLLSDREGGFIDVSETVGFDHAHRNRAVVVVDLDHDHRPELVTAGLAQVTVNRFTGGCPSRLTVSAEGALAVGAQLEIEARGRSYTRWLLPDTTNSRSQMASFIGLGDAPTADRVTIRWMDGRVDERTDVPANSHLHFER